MKKVSAAVALISVGAIMFPIVAFAIVSQPNLNYFTLLGNQIIAVLRLLIPIVFSLAVIYFFWGLAKFILAAGDEEARAAGKQIMLWGVVAIFVMASVYGLVTLLGSIVGVAPVTNQIIPTVPR